MAMAQPPIPDHLRPHIWAVSRYHYPAYPNLPVNVVAEFLFQAINVATTAPFAWDFIDCPAPGTLFFVWMSPNTFVSPPTDGYSYLDPENVLHLPVGDKVPPPFAIFNWRRWSKYTNTNTDLILVQKE